MCGDIAALSDVWWPVFLELCVRDASQGVVLYRMREQITERAYTAAQWEEMLRDAGFRILTRYDGYTENPPSVHSERIVYAVQKE